MNAIEIKNLTKDFGEKRAVAGLDMTVPVGSIYGFIGENGSGKSTTEKIICGLTHSNGGSIKLFGKDYTDIDVRANIGVLIESPGCFPNLTVWNNLMIQAKNLSLDDAENKVREVLKLVRMEGASSNKFKNCSLGMKQRIGIAMALLGNPKLLVLDEPINGLDADGMRIMREILVDLTKDKKCTILVSSHILSELEKVATHYGIIRGGKMIKEMTSEELDASCPTFVSIKTANLEKTFKVLSEKYDKVELDGENTLIRIYDNISSDEIAKYLYKKKIIVTELQTSKIGLEEFYINLMKGESKK